MTIKTSGAAQWPAKMLEALGLDPSRVYSFTLHASARDVPLLTVRLLPDPDLDPTLIEQVFRLVELAEDEPSASAQPRSTCRVIDVGGTTARVQGDPNPTPEVAAAIERVIAAAAQQLGADRG
jgi:hypothetical protein